MHPTLRQPLPPHPTRPAAGAPAHRPERAPRLTLWRLALQARWRRGVKRLHRPLWMARLREANTLASHPAVDPHGDGPVVCLTTYGERLQSVFYVLESIAAGELRPTRLVLFIDRQLYARGLPVELRRLQARGLEVWPCEDMGPHTKYIHWVMSGSTTHRPLVTADDDQLYPRDWLQGLWAAHQAAPQHIHCYRAHQIARDAQGRLLPYRQWPGCDSRQPSAHHFLTGVSGVLYPATMQGALRAAGFGFLHACPQADDIWLNAIALRSSHLVQQLDWRSRSFYELPGTREQGLARGNVAGGQNDRQLHQTYGSDDLDLLRAT